MWDVTQEAQDARGRPAATLVGVVSEDERHTKGHITAKRGRAGRKKQLGRLQRRVLVWLLGRHQHIEHHGTDSERRMLINRGVPWLRVNERLGVTSGDLSRALQGSAPGQRSLVARQLVSLYRSGRRTTHVRLTPSGRELAQVFGPQAEKAPKSEEAELARLPASGLLGRKLEKLTTEEALELLTGEYAKQKR